MTSPLLHYDKSSSYADARARIDRIAAHVAASAQDIIDAHANRDWIALGYESWNELCEAEFRGAVIGLPREQRREVVREMTEAGMSTRAIGGALGVSQPTVWRDREAGDSNESPDDSPAPVTGLDGKTYTRPPRPTITVDSETGEIIDGPTPGPSITEAEKERRREESRVAAIRRYVADMNLAFAGLSMLKHDQHRQTLLNHWEPTSTEWSAADLHEFADLLHELANDWNH